MHRLANKRILLGMTGSIAAYKSAEIIRQLRNANADVRVVMTKSAKQFITPLTIQALCSHPIHDDLLDPKAEAAMGHIELARWADLILVAPASANFMAKLAQGRGDDLLTTLCLATQSPIAIAPAMNKNMWQNKASQDNVTLLRNHGIYLFGPDHGSQACGDIGPGRMLEPTNIVNLTTDIFQSEKLVGKQVLITAGPTHEAIDPVRYLTNKSSGRMGYALAEAAESAGAIVTLISGPTKLTPPDRVNYINVVNAHQMHTEVLNNLTHCDIFIGAAAVADFRPETQSATKIKKKTEILTIKLVPNPDIISSVVEQNKKSFVVGFAAETHDMLDFAKIKLENKKLDMIIANDVSKSDIGFDSEDNAVTILSPQETITIPKSHKTKLARQLVAIIAKQYNETGYEKASS